MEHKLFKVGDVFGNKRMKKYLKSYLLTVKEKYAFISYK